LIELRREYVPAAQLIHCVDFLVPPEEFLAWNPAVQFKQRSDNGTGA
jgi:hypothetical protein